MNQPCNPNDYTQPIQRVDPRRAVPPHPGGHGHGHQAAPEPRPSRAESRAAQEPRKRRRWPWVVGGTVLVLVIIGSVNGGGQTSPTPSAPAAGAPAAAAPVELPEVPAVSASDDTAHMEVTGSGKALVTYMKKGGQEQKEVSLPWSADVEVDFITSLTAQKKSGGSGEIGCKVTKGGEVVADNTSSGAYAVVSCVG